MIFIIQNIKQKIVKIDSFRSELKILFGFLKGRKLRSSLQKNYSDVSIKNIDILQNQQYIANTADSAQEQYSY